MIVATSNVCYVDRALKVLVVVILCQATVVGATGAIAGEVTAVHVITGAQSHNCR